MRRLLSHLTASQAVRKQHKKLEPEYPVGAIYTPPLPLGSSYGEVHEYPKYSFDSTECIAVITSWLQSCMRNHAACSIETEHQSPPRRLISIGDGDEEPLLRLIETEGKHMPYYALSHCWDKNATLKTTTKSLKERRQDIAWSKLSYTFRDFLTIAVRLRTTFGTCHVWIDSLCIVQDDREDWLRETANMDSIYANADLVIAATGAIDGKAGFFQPRSLPQSQIKHVICRESVSHLMTSDAYAHDLFKREPIQNTSSIGWAMHDNPLFLRAWCLQERLLATRVLHFTRGEMVFECRSDVRCECNAFERRRDWLLDANEKVDFDHFITHKSLGTARSWDNWWYFVESFSRRYVTEPTDRLPALAGAARRVAREELGTYLAGMWRQGLESNLIWEAAHGSYRHGVQSRQEAPYVAPSWSWASMAPGIAVSRRQPYSSKRAYPRKIVAKVLDAACTPSSWDPYGQVSAGFLLIHGYTIDVVLKREDGRFNAYQKRWPSHQHDYPLDITPDTDLELGANRVVMGKTALKCLLVLWEMETHHYRDHGEESVIPTAYEFETLAQRRAWQEAGADDCTAYYYWALLLQPVKGQERTYRRIAVSRITGETWAPLIEQDGSEQYMETLRIV
ncbi:hypothetical protein MMC10_000899 [Thelotrema lepadinum]|nr:hypothetical protein [Thelotrema lepadinum]